VLAAPLAGCGSLPAPVGRGATAEPFLAAEHAFVVRAEVVRPGVARPSPVGSRPAPIPVVKLVMKPVLRPVVKRIVMPVPRVAATQRPVRRVESAAQRGARVLASLRYPYQWLGYRIEFLPDKHGYLGLTRSDQRLIQIYVRSSESDLVLSHSIAHEIGHALDFSRSSLVTHRAYLTIRGLSTSLDWYGCSGCTDYRTPAGDWAEVFAYWLAGPGDFRSQVAGAPSRTQLKALGALFAL
jgi:hypothetical protein